MRSSWLTMVALTLLGGCGTAQNQAVGYGRDERARLDRGRDSVQTNDSSSKVAIHDPHFRKEKSGKH